MWLYAGAEHYTSDNRFVDGYNKNNRNKGEKGFDINKWVWDRKVKYFNKNINIISTSDWQERNAKKSFLLKHNNIHKIPLPIDLNFWKPINKDEARKNLNWSKNKIQWQHLKAKSKLVVQTSLVKA